MQKGDKLDIREYFDGLKLCLIIDPIVESVEIINEKIGEREGYLRVTIKFPDDSVMHCFEYVIFDETVEISKYSFHWQDAAGNLIRRWDNAPHHPELDRYQHHVHTKDIVSASSEIGIRTVLITVKSILSQRNQHIWIANSTNRT